MFSSYGNTQHSVSPSPEALVKISNPSDFSKICDVMGIIDSGAVMTCIPESILSQLGKLTYSSVSIRDINGNIINRKTYIIDIQIEDYQIKNVEVIVVPKRYTLIGRDIINQFKIVLDGPKLQWSIEKPSLFF